MHWKIVTVGKPSLGWAREAVEDYLQRLTRMTKVEWIALKPGRAVEIEARMLELGRGHLCIALDERGKERRSVELARWIADREMSSTKGVCLFVGGSDGHGDALRQAVQETWSLSRLTLQHELALVVLMEQIYRAYSIHRGDPYHRE